MAPTIRQLTAREEPAWDRYLEEAPEATFFHRAGWRHVIETGFRQNAHYLLAEQDGAVTGVLPLIHMRSLLFGNRLVSAPFCVYGGPVASELAAHQALVDHAIDLMRRVGADFLEFRNRTPQMNDWATQSDVYATFRKQISVDPEINMKAIPRKQRAVLRKGFDYKLKSRIGHDPKLFYSLYAESVRNLGTPIFSRNYLNALLHTFRDCVEILTVIDDDEPICTVLSFFFRDEVLPYYGGGKPRARQRAASDFMYWEVMTGAAQRGARIFDFGRSKYGTGSFAFKKNWGFSPEPLHYQYFVKDGAQIPDNTPLNPRYRTMIETWKRLPMPVANLIGPAIVRGIG